MITIDWIAFAQVFVGALVAACLVVGFYALGLRLLVRAGRPPVVAPAEFTDAITVVSPRDRDRAVHKAAKAARRSPLTEGQKRVALVGAWSAFGLCGLAVAAGIVLIVVGV